MTRSGHHPIERVMQSVTEAVPKASSVPKRSVFHIRVASNGMNNPTGTIYHNGHLRLLALFSCIVYLTGCMASPFAFTLLAPEIVDTMSRPSPPIAPSLGSVPRVDRRQIILDQLAKEGTAAVIGQSARGSDILAYRFGRGPTAVISVGGIHGGYEANTVLLLQRFVEELASDISIVPESITLYLIPVMNPDGYTKRGLPGRVNANWVDLNRNWGCNWEKSSGFYHNTFYRTGTRAFSEPESRAVRDFVDYVNGRVVIFYHSHGGFIFYGDCNQDEGSLNLARAVRETTGYPIWNPSHSLGDSNKPTITGDATDYFDQIGIHAIGIELPSFNETEIDWEVSYAGLLQILTYSAELE